MTKEIRKLEELDSVMKTESLALYGAGDTTKHMLKYAACKSYPVDSIIVSYQLGNESSLMGVPVKIVKELTVENIHNLVVIVCVTKKWISEIENEISNYGFKKVYFLNDELIREVIFKNADFDVRTYEEVLRLQDTVNWQATRLLRFVPRPCLEYMIVHIVDHCNLRCQGCDHFACIADENFIPFETIERDIIRMADIFQGDYIVKIAVMGGEPLLHPQLKDILVCIRKYFPHTIIRLSTNGLLLKAQDEKFWSVLRENNVMIVMTKYPISLDFDGIINKSREEGVEFIFHEGTGGDYIKHSFKKRINLRGDSNPVESFATCHISNYGNQLLEGKFYACAFSCQSYRIFNKKFNQNLRLTEDDYLDIYKVNDRKEFFEFAARPKYYCRYCMGLSPEFSWARSKQQISEWVDIENESF